MTAHLAANGSQLFGFRRVLAQQTHHGVNRAAGVGVRVVGGGLQLGGLVLLLHVQVFLLGGQDADVGDFARQPRFGWSACHFGEVSAPRESLRCLTPRRTRHVIYLAEDREMT